MSRLAVVVVNYYSHSLLATNLVRTQAQLPDALVIVVDNSVDEAEGAALAGLADRHGWQMVPSPANGGFGDGVNLGAARAIAAGCSRLLIINPDATIAAPDVAALLAQVDADPLVMVAPKIVSSTGELWSRGTWLCLDHGRMHSPGKAHPCNEHRNEFWLSGAVLLMSADLWQRAGGFRSEYFLYWEDVDLCHRVLQLGGSLRLVEEASAVHDEGGTQRHDAAGTRAKSEGYYYYNIRNRLLFAALNLSGAQQRGWRRNAVGESGRIVLRGGGRQLVKSAAPYRAMMRGLRDGLRVLRESGADRQ